ncbi:MAG TPA: hypothetical protein VME46_03665 [Acidimicrobiales bacterium]|nr:hypothetical protein [Acidimicrobiales bacterium]
MTAPSYARPAAGPVAGYCGRCGTPYSPGHGPFCGRCGNRVGQQPPVALGYSYPVVAAVSVPAAQHKLSHGRLLIAAALCLGVVVAAVTALAVSLRPTVNYCHFSCGPETGPRLLSSVAYVSSRFGYRVEYEKSVFQSANPTATGVELDGGFGFMVFNATAGDNVTAGITGAMKSLNSNLVQDLQPLSNDVPGAEVGLEPGTGEVDTATYVPPNGGQDVPVSVLAMAASNGQFTISVVVVGEQDKSSVEALPFFFAANYYYDFPVSNTVWPGQA